MNCSKNEPEAYRYDRVFKTRNGCVLRELGDEGRDPLFRFNFHKGFSDKYHILSSSAETTYSGTLILPLFDPNFVLFPNGGLHGKGFEIIEEIEIFPSLSRCMERPQDTHSKIFPLNNPVRVLVKNQTHAKLNGNT